MNLPNWITLFRIILIPFFVGLILKYKQTQINFYLFAAQGVFILAVISDALDGAVARIRKQKTFLGTVLDPLADKMLLLSAVLLLSLPITGFVQLPIWIPVTFISRDLILILGAAVIYMHNNGNLKVTPNKIGKFTTFFQMLTVIFIIGKFPHPQWIWRIAGFSTIVSGIVYVYKGSKQLK